MTNITKKEIPIFFATGDDDYMNFLGVTVASIKENSSKDRNYRIIVLNDGMSQKTIDSYSYLVDDNFKIDFVDISKDIEDHQDGFKVVYHFGKYAYYRLFIPKLFPQYDKAIYLDSDIVVLNDIAKLYDYDLGDNLIGAIREQNIPRVEEFRNYTKQAVGIDCSEYINSGVLLMNTAKFREDDILNLFLKINDKYNFRLVDPDQAYINYLCHGKIKYLPNGWNKAPYDTEPEGGLNLVHYALYKKPWQFDDLLYKEYFWDYAKRTPFYDKIVDIKNSFTPEQKAKKEQANVRIVEEAQEIVDSGFTFVSELPSDPMLLKDKLISKEESELNI